MVSAMWRRSEPINLESHLFYQLLRNTPLPLVPALLRRRKSALLSKLEKEFRSYIKNTNIKFVLDDKTSPDDLACLDSELVHRALMNILCNATEHGGNIEKIILTVIHYHNEFHFKIQDDGDGFSEESLKHGMELFFMQDKARRSNHYGIGLYFANQVAMMHGGLISIRNNNIGGQVRLTLPLSK